MDTPIGVSTVKKCKIDNCENEIIAKGLCRKHYLRNYRNGSPHIKKQPKEYAKKGMESPNATHAMYSHPLYKTWINMLSRCNNKNDHAYINYGARGITVCEEWSSIFKFIEDMGERPEGFSLERKNNKLGYSKSNCIWADKKTQARNRRNVKLTKEKADEIRRLRLEGLKRKEIANMFNVSLSTVKKIISGDYWT